jgi:hypothetical protein
MDLPAETHIGQQALQVSDKFSDKSSRFYLMATANSICDKRH